MNKKLLLLSLFLTIGIGLASYSIAHAFFTSAANSTNNTFTASSKFPVSPTLTPTSGKIVINEVSPLGAANTEWVELFNSGGSSVDVSGWTISDTTGPADTLPTVTPIPAGAFAVIVTSDNTTTVVPTSATKIVLTGTSGTRIGNGLNDTGDSVTLRNGTTVIDAMSYGNDASVFTTNRPGVPTTGKTISRIPNGIDTDLGTDWQTSTNPTVGITN